MLEGRIVVIFVGWWVVVTEIEYEEALWGADNVLLLDLCTG